MARGLCKEEEEEERAEWKEIPGEMAWKHLM